MASRGGSRQSRLVPAEFVVLRLGGICQGNARLTRLQWWVGGNFFRKEKQMAAYEWKTKSMIKADPNEAGKQFEELERTVGLTAENVVNTNREEGTPLHDEFEWNNDIAAENYRLMQARHLIGNICVRVETKQGEIVQQRVFLKTTECSPYESVSVIIKDEDKHAAMLERALKELTAFMKKYQVLKELYPLKSVIDDIQKEAG